MPNLDLLKNNLISERVPGAQIGASNHSLKAIADLGGQAAEFAMGLYNKQKQAESKTFITQSTMDFERNYNDYVNKSKGSFGKDYKKMIGDFESQGNKMIGQFASTAPDEDTKKEFELRARQFHTGSLIKSDNEINELKIQDGIKTLNDSTSFRLKKMQDFPDDAANDLIYKEGRAEIESDTFLPQEEKNKLIQQYDKGSIDAIANGYLSAGVKLGTNGQLQKELYSYKKGLDRLKSNDPLFSKMTPDERLSYETKFENAFKVAKQRNTEHTEQRVNAILSAKGDLSEKSYVDVKTLIENSTLDPIKKDIFRYKLATSLIEKKSKSVLSLVPPDQRDPDRLIKELRNGIQDPSLRDAFNSDAHETVRASLEAADLELGKDAPSYFYKNDPEVARLSEQTKMGDPESFKQLQVLLDAHYNNFKIPSSARKYTTPQMRQFWKSSFDNSKSNPPMMLEIIDDIKLSTGDLSYKAMQEAGIPLEYAVISDVDDKNMRTRMVSNVIQFDKQALEDKGVSSNKIDILRAKLTTSNYIKAIEKTGGNRGHERAKAAVDQMIYEYGARIRENVDPANAKEDLESIFSSSKKLVKNRETTFTYPTSQDGEKIERFAEVMTGNDVDFVKDLDLNTYGPELHQSTNEDLKRNGRWLNNADGTGIDLWSRNPDGRLARVERINEKGVKSQVSLNWEQVANFKPQTKGDKFSERTKKAKENLGKPVKPISNSDFIKFWESK